MPVREIPLNKISPFQCRAEFKDSVVEEYRQPMKAGSMPPVEVYEDDGMFYLWDGNYRIAAAKAEGLKEVKANVLQGTRRDAELKALGANGGERRSTEDKKAAVERALKDDEWKNNSTAWLSQYCRVSEAFVERIRKSLTGSRAGTTAEKGDTKPDEKPDAKPEPMVLCNRCKRTGPVKDCATCKKLREDVKAGKKRVGRDGRAQATKKGATAKPAKNGQVIPPWKDCEAVVGPVVRKLTEFFKVFGMKDKPVHMGFKKRLDDLVNDWKAEHKKLSKGAT